MLFDYAERITAHRKNKNKRIGHRNQMEVKSVYFIGIGGIGMSAIARYFNSINYSVAGYDLTESPLTQELVKEGINIHYEDNVEAIPLECKSNETLIVYTPAVPKTHSELQFFQAQGNKIMKRAEVLGLITRDQVGLCVAGTHGKTTTSTLLAHLLYSSKLKCNAFLGGIANNYGTNLLLDEASDKFVIEADEFDRSFHHLRPQMAVITSSDPDHLDIYETEEAYKESFEHFTSLIKDGGCLVQHKDVTINPRLNPKTKLYSYAVNEQADFYASDIVVNDARLFFQWHYRDLRTGELASAPFELGVPLLINIDNAVASLALAYLSGASIKELQEALQSFRGVQRRFDRHILQGTYLLIDDYAHHPTELKASIESVRFLYPNRKIIGVFQPHLFSRTQDFYLEFAESLSSLDELILLPIYPARELPIEGVNSELICKHVQGTKAQVLEKEAMLEYLQQIEEQNTVILCLGAGDIGLLLRPIKAILQEKNKQK